MRISLMASCALLISAPAFGQAFNIDIGNNVQFPLPTNALGAAASQPGVWDAVPGIPGTTAALKNIAGTVTAVSLNGVGGNAFEFNNAGTLGDDQNLMDDGNDPGALGTWTFSGLAAGNYIVYTYAWAPDSALFISKVAVAGSSDPQQTVGGAWPSGYVLGVTHSRHHATVTAGGTIVVTITVGTSFATLDGFQIVPDVPTFTSFCDPGVGGIISCPCANAPSGSGRGCDNSALTGGAMLGAGGTASLTGDTLVFTTANEKPTATSIVLQGDGVNPTGLVFGQGVRCLVGNPFLKRLYVKPASGGSITAPSGTDLSVSAQSATLGDTIPPAAHRYYMVYYRDPIVSGGCPATSTFNATQTLDVTWTP